MWPFAMLLFKYFKNKRGVDLMFPRLIKYLEMYYI